MAEFLELVESIRAEEASTEKLFGEGRGFRGQKNQKYLAALVEATRLVESVLKGTTPIRRLQEAMSTSDFPYLFGDILDRQVLANYREWPAVWKRFAKRGTVRDFRTAKSFKLDGAEGQLQQVVELGEYPAASLTDGEYTRSVKKYGRRLPLSWETLINDDLDQLRSVPERFGRASRRSESKAVTQLYCDANGPHASFYTAGNGNLITGNPVLSVAAVQAGLNTLFDQRDADDEPIVIEMVKLVVPPHLKVTAENILNALTIELAENGGTANQKLTARNWMAGSLELVVDPYIPVVATTNGKTSWFMFADPATGRPAIGLDFLRGHEEPELFMKTPNATRVGGGIVTPMDGDFETDSLEYKIRHCFGGYRVDPKMSVASNGSGS